LAAREKELCASEEVGGHSALQKRPDLSDAIDTDENRVVDREELTGALQAGLSQDSNRQSEPPTAKLPSEERPELPSARVPKEFDYRAGDKLDMPYRGSGMHLPDEQALELSRVDSAAASYGPYDREEWNAAHRGMPSFDSMDRNSDGMIYRSEWEHTVGRSWNPPQSSRYPSSVNVANPGRSTLLPAAGNYPSPGEGYGEASQRSVFPQPQPHQRRSYLGSNEAQYPRSPPYPSTASSTGAWPYREASQHSVAPQSLPHQRRSYAGERQ